MCFDLSDICKMSPTDIYTTQSWFVVLSLWVQKINEATSQDYYSTPEKDRAKLGKKKFYFGRGIIGEEKKITSKPIIIRTLADRLNGNRKS